MSAYVSHVIGYRGVYVLDYTESSGQVNLTDELDEALLINNALTAEIIMNAVRKTGEVCQHMVIIPVDVTITLTRR